VQDARVGATRAEREAELGLEQYRLHPTPRERVRDGAADDAPTDDGDLCVRAGHGRQALYGLTSAWPEAVAARIANRTAGHFAAQLFSSLLEFNIAQKFFDRILEQAEAARLTSDEHFSVDGTLIEAWASQKSFQRKDQQEPPPPDDPGNPTVNFHGEKRSNDTHESKTDPEARLARKGGGHESKLAYCGNLMIENRNGLVVDTLLVQPSGTAERDAAMLMAERIEGTERVTVAADKAYDTKDLVAVMRELNVTPHVTQNEKRPGGSAIDGRTTRHAGYQLSQRKRKRIEEVFGWMKTVGMLRKTRHRGVFKVGWVFTFTAAAYNLVRMRNLLYFAVQSA